MLSLWAFSREKKLFPRWWEPTKKFTKETNSPRALISGQTVSDKHSGNFATALGLFLVLVNSFANWDMKRTQVKIVWRKKK